MTTEASNSLELPRDGNSICASDLLQVQHLGRGSFGIAKLMLYEPTAELVAVKFLERGPQVRAADSKL